MILVTGGTGLVGAHLLYSLLEKGHKVRATKRRHSNIEKTKKIFNYYSDKASVLFNQIEWVNADILDPQSLASSLSGATQVYHCAAMVSFDSADKWKMLNNNINGTANLVNACLENGNIQKFCFVSSVAAIGNAPQNEQADETTPWTRSSNHSNYAISKFRSELEVWRGISEGLNAVMVNPGIILGPGDWKNSSSSMFHAVWRGLNFFTYGGTGFVDVRDVVTIMIRLMESDISAQRFVVNAENVLYQQLFNMIADNLKKKKPSIYANRFMTGLAWRFEKLKALITRQKPMLTKEAARSSHQKGLYSNKKIKKYLDYDFIPIEKSVKDFSAMFLKDYSKSS